MRLTHRYPIFQCPVCGKRFVRMRRVKLRSGGYTLTWDTRVIYCSNKCRQKAYRRRVFSRPLFPSL
jgi:hypothetical protein